MRHFERAGERPGGFGKGPRGPLGAGRVQTYTKLTTYSRRSWGLRKADLDLKTLSTAWGGYGCHESAMLRAKAEVTHCNGPYWDQWHIGRGQPRGARSCTDVILHVSSLFEGATCTGMLLLQQLHCC